MSETQASYRERDIELVYRLGDELPAAISSRNHSLRVASKCLSRTSLLIKHRLSYGQPSLHDQAHRIERVIFDVGLQDGQLVFRSMASGCASVPDVLPFEPDPVFEELLRQLDTRLHVESRADGWALWFVIACAPMQPAPP